MRESLTQRMSNPDTVAVAGLVRDGLMAGHLAFLTVSSGSMAPLLRIGDQVGVQHVIPEQLCPGDVIVLHHRQLILTHRLRRLQSREPRTILITRGDRSPRFDPPWSESHLLGRVVVRQRGQHQLWLDYGYGRWLNRRLAQLSKFEEGALERYSSSSGPDKIPLTTRLVRISLRTVAGALTGLVDKADEYRDWQ